MLTILAIALQVLATFLVADLVTGLVHWLEDVYADESMPVIGRYVARTNIVHHHFPRHFIHLTWWQSSWVLCLLSALIVGAAWIVGLLTWHVWLFAALSANANQIHKWAHQTRAENGSVVTFLQRLRVLQTPRHHARHHTDPKDCHYCTMSNLLNPLLDGINFWAGLEFLFTKVTGIPRRPDTSVAGHGPGPAWLEDYRPRHAQTTAAGSCHRSSLPPGNPARAAVTACPSSGRRCRDCARAEGRPHPTVP
jgi:ubiquitin-conjugating enzyme E2 variant